MSEFIGKYKHLKSENLDEYFKAVGVPLIPRKLVCMSSPEIEISYENDEWSFKNSSMLRTTVIKFHLNKEFEESMPNGEVLKSTTIREGDNKFIITSVSSKSNVKTKRTYEFNDTGCVLTLFIEKEPQDVIATRHFEKIV